MKFTTFPVVFYRESFFFLTLFTFLKPAAPIPLLLDVIPPRAPAELVKLTTMMSLFKTETFLSFLK